MPLKQRLGHSTLWMSIAAGGSSIVSFVIFAVLSRILSPEDIGLVAFALIFTELGKIVVNMGLPQAVVQHHEWNERLSSSCFWLNVLLSLVATALILLVIAPLAAIFYDPAVVPILYALSVIFVIEGLKGVHEGKLKRDFKFREIALRTVLSGFLSGLAGIYLALQGYGVWALVWQQLVYHGLIALATWWAASWLPKLAFSLNDARQVLRFSWPVMVAQFMGNMNPRVFELLVGVIIGPAALGFVKVGGRALFVLQEVALKPFKHTALSALSRLETRELQAEATQRLIRVSAYTAFPVFFGAAAVGPEFVTLAFGEKWALSGSIMAILAVGVCPLAIAYHINSVLTATGNSHLVMRIGGAELVLSFVIGVLSVPLGILVAAAGLSLRSYITLTISLSHYQRVFGVRPLTVVKTVLPAYCASLLMFLLVSAARPLMPANMPEAFELAALCAIGVIIQALLMATIFKAETKNFLVEGLDLLPGRVKPTAMALHRLIG